MRDIVRSYRLSIVTLTSMSIATLASIEGPTLQLVAPLAFKSKADAVYDEIKQRILRGDLPPATTLNQVQLAAMLQVSTTPLREALRRLETEGLLRSSAHRDITVVPLSVEEFQALWEVRLDLDPSAVALAAQRYVSSDRSQMLAAAEDASEKSDDSGAVQRDREFHSAIYHACHNPVLIELLDVLWNRADRYRMLVPTASSASETVHEDGELLHLEHAELLRLVLGRQARSAARLMKSHLQEQRRLVEQSLLSQ